MATYRIGELDQRIQIYRRVTAPDSQGGQVVTEVLRYSLAAHVMVKGGNEIFKYEKVEAVASTTFVIRNTRNLVIREDDFILWDGEKYNIRNISNKGLRQLYLEIDAERGVAQ